MVLTERALERISNLEEKQIKTKDEFEELDDLYLLLKCSSMDEYLEVKSSTNI